MNDRSISRLITHALAARRLAYAPYSNYQVGAALLLKSGKIVRGCNVENASYGLTICAERSAVVSAVSAGYREFVAIAVATRDGGSPCGACRQVLSEFGPNLIVIMCDESGGRTISSIAELLPLGFASSSLTQS